jgi:hypothetical protein
MKLNLSWKKEIFKMHAGDSGGRKLIFPGSIWGQVGEPCPINKDLPTKQP